MKPEHNFEWLHVGPILLTLLCNILHDGDASSASSWRSNSFSARAPDTAYIGGMASELINQPALETMEYLFEQHFKRQTERSEKRKDKDYDKGVEEMLQAEHE